MGRNGHRAGGKHRGGRRGGRGEPERKPRAASSSDDNTAAPRNAASPADGVGEVDEHDEGADQGLGARSQPDSADGGQSPELPPAEPRHRPDARHGAKPRGPRGGDARVQSRYVFAARCQDGSKAEEGQCRASNPASRNDFWSPTPDELEGLERCKLEPKPEGQGHHNSAAGNPLGHGVVGDPPRRSDSGAEPEPPRWSLGNHNGTQAQNGAEHGYGRGDGGGGGGGSHACWNGGSHTGSAEPWHQIPPAPEASQAQAAGAGLDGQWPRGQTIRTAWPGTPLIKWPRWSPPQEALAPSNNGRWQPPPAAETRLWPGPCGGNNPHEPWLTPAPEPAPNCRWSRGGRRTAAPWPGRGRRQFGPHGPQHCYQTEWPERQRETPAWRQDVGERRAVWDVGERRAVWDADERRAAWDDAWKKFIRCSADPIEVARTLHCGTETDWGKLYARFVCTAPRTAVAPAFDRHASRIGKATAARITAQF